jgi:hypothetical protein
VLSLLVLAARSRRKSLAALPPSFALPLPMSARRADKWPPRAVAIRGGGPPLEQTRHQPRPLVIQGQALPAVPVETDNGAISKFLSSRTQLKLQRNAPFTSLHRPTPRSLHGPLDVYSVAPPAIKRSPSRDLLLPTLFSHNASPFCLTLVCGGHRPCRCSSPIQSTSASPAFRDGLKSPAIPPSGSHISPDRIDRLCLLR